MEIEQKQVVSGQAVDEMAQEARSRAVEKASDHLVNQILDQLDKKAAVRKMRQESIARAREMLAAQRDGRVVSAKPQTKTPKATRAKVATEPGSLKPRKVSRVRRDEPALLTDDTRVRESGKDL